MKKSISILGFLLFILSTFFDGNITQAAAVPQISIRYNTPSPLGASAAVRRTYNPCGRSVFAKLTALPAGSSVHMLMYSLSFIELVNKLKAIATAGRKVCIVVDRGQYNNATMQNRVNDLANQANITVRIIGRPRGNAGTTWQNEVTLHEKSTLLKNGENETLMLGSYNWSYAASERNFENCVFMEKKADGNEDINAVVNTAKTRFDELWKGSKRLRTVDPIEAPSDCLMTPPPPPAAVEEALDPGREGDEEEEKGRRDRRRGKAPTAAAPVAAESNIRGRSKGSGRKQEGKTHSALRRTGKEVVAGSRPEADGKIHPYYKGSPLRRDPRDKRSREKPAATSPAVTRLQTALIAE